MPTQPAERADPLNSSAAASAGIAAILVRGAREHNLKNVSLSIPHNRLVALTGPSGSGKSSLAIDTLHAEGQRQYIESLSVYARQFLEEMKRPEVDAIEALPPTLCIEQNYRVNNPRSTVATVAEIYDFLRLLYARLGKPHCPQCGAAIEQQSPEQIVESILGLPDETKLMILAPLDSARGARQKAIAAARQAGLIRIRIDGEVYDIDAAPELSDARVLTLQAVVDRVIVRSGVEARVSESVSLALKLGGDRVLISYQSRNQREDRSAAPPPTESAAAATSCWRERHFSTRFSCPQCDASVPDIEPRTFSFASPFGACPNCEGLGWVDREERVRCPACGGSRLRAEARSVTLHGKGIHEVTALSVADASAFFAGLQWSAAEQPVARPLTDEIVRRLGFLGRVGVEYLTLDRGADTLSGGELQRVRLATSLGSGLTGVCYLLDEPSIGLHPRDNAKLIDAMTRLCDQGATVVVVEHDEAIMRAADYLIDFGPSAGAAGGQVVATGTPDQLETRDGLSATAAFLSGARRIAVPAARRTPDASRQLTLKGVTTNNLKSVTARFPLGLFVCVTGVSGSGKSSLINDTLAPALKTRLSPPGRKGGRRKAAPENGPPTATPLGLKSLHGAENLSKLVAIDQAPLGRTPRGNPATYSGVFDEIRKIYASVKLARQRGYRANRFSFNVKGGRCETCQGQGLTRVEMSFLPDIYVTCKACGGRRFNHATLEVRFKGKSIADCLEMSIEQACDFFESVPSVHRILECLQDVGLGYLALGQPSNTLSGGEAQRLKLGAELAAPAAGHVLYLMDEPTTGLHPVDVERLLAVLQRLVDKGNTVLVVEHHLDVIKSADWVIDLGPEGGAGGGEIIAEGPPEHIASVAASYTGQWLRQTLA